MLAYKLNFSPDIAIEFYWGQLINLSQLAVLKNLRDKNALLMAKLRSTSSKTKLLENCYHLFTHTYQKDRERCQIKSVNIHH